MLSVSEEHRAFELLELCGGRLHPADTVLRGPPEAGVPQSSHLVGRITGLHSNRDPIYLIA
jgi:hypothetical protein